MDSIQLSEIKLSKLQFLESPIFVYTVSAALQENIVLLHLPSSKGILIDKIGYVVEQ